MEKTWDVVSILFLILYRGVSPDWGRDLAKDTQQLVAEMRFEPHSLMVVELFPCRGSLKVFATQAEILG